MLTPEERARIQDEERKRIDEEEYRAEVRAKLRADHGAPPKKSNALAWVVGIGVVVIIGGAILFNSNFAGAGGQATRTAGASPEMEPKTRYVPVDQKIATGQIVVKANGYVQYRITVTPVMLEPTLTGSFTCSGGSGNDIQAVIADETNFMNWINGHQARVFWGTEGKETTGRFDVRLGLGTYYLVFSNRFSAFTDKQVFLEADLNYRKAQTYF